MSYDIKNFEISEETEKIAMKSFILSSKIHVEDIEDASFDDLKQIVNEILAVPLKEEENKQLSIEDVVPELHQTNYTQPLITEDVLSKKEEYKQESIEDVFGKDIYYFQQTQISKNKKYNVTINPTTRVFSRVRRKNK